MRGLEAGWGRSSGNRLRTAQVKFEALAGCNRHSGSLGQRTQRRANNRVIGRWHVLIKQRAGAEQEDGEFRPGNGIHCSCDIRPQVCDQKVTGRQPNHRGRVSLPQASVEHVDSDNERHRPCGTADHGNGVHRKGAAATQQAGGHDSSLQSCTKEYVEVAGSVGVLAALAAASNTTGPRTRRMATKAVSAK